MITDKEKSYWDVITSFDVKKGDTIFLVSAIYSSGDSFGRSTGNIEYVGAYQTKEFAEKVRKYILHDYERYLGDKSCRQEYKIEVDDEVIYTSAWIDYFETLNSVEIDKLVVK